MNALCLCTLALSLTVGIDALQPRIAPRRIAELHTGGYARWRTALLHTAPGGDDAASLFAEAARLQREAAESESELAPTVTAEAPPPPPPKGLSAVLPITRSDWSVEDTECFFEPRTQGSSLLQFDVAVPCGVILQESDDPEGRPIVVVGAVGEGSNAEAAGLLPGDILRATSAVRQQMEMPTWQILGADAVSAIDCTRQWRGG